MPSIRTFHSARQPTRCCQARTISSEALYRLPGCRLPLTLFVKDSAGLRRIVEQPIKRSHSLPTRPWNLLIFAIDSLRADHMSCYGYQRPTTPYADRLASEGVLFENLYSAYIPTTPAYTTIFTGMDVMTHEMVSLSPKGPIAEEIKLLPELLQEAGYVSFRVGFGGEFFRG